MARTNGVGGDPSPFAEWVGRHPVLWGLGSGLTFFLAGLAIFGNVGVALLGAVVLGGVNTWMWSSAGPAARWRAWILDRFPKD
jgi:hypothetical protein